MLLQPALRATYI